MNSIYVALICFIGALITGILGWMKAGGPFDLKSFANTIYSGLGAALVFALAYNYSEGGLKAFDVLAALAAGMGVDNAVNRIIGSVQKK